MCVVMDEREKEALVHIATFFRVCLAPWRGVKKLDAEMKASEGEWRPYVSVAQKVQREKKNQKPF